MAFNEDYIKTYLMKLGLTEYEAKIYIVLVKMGQKNAGEISFLSKVPRPKTYGAIRSLERKGFLKVILGKPERYSAVSPNDVLLPLVERLTKDAEECNRILEDLALSFEASKYVHMDKPYETRDFWALKGRDKVNSKISEMITNAENSIFIVTTANGIIRMYKAHSNTLEKARANGVTVKVIAPSTRENQSAIKDLREIIEIKTRDPYLPRYVCIDNNEIIFIEAIPDDHNADEGQDAASWTNDPLLIRMHKQAFLNLWKTA